MNFFCIDLTEEQTQDFKRQASPDAVFLHVSHDDNLSDFFKKHNGQSRILIEKSNTEFILKWESSLFLEFPEFELVYINGNDELPSIEGLDISEVDQTDNGLDLGLDDLAGGDELSLSDLDDDSHIGGELEIGEADQTDNGLDLGLDDLAGGDELSLSDLGDDSHIGGELEIGEADQSDNGLDLGLDDLADDDELSLGGLDEDSHQSGHESGTLNAESSDSGLDFNLGDLDADEFKIPDEIDSSDNDELLIDTLSEEISDTTNEDESLDESLDISFSEPEKTNTQEEVQKTQLSLDAIDDDSLFGEMDELTENDFSIDDIESSLETSNHNPEPLSRELIEKIDKPSPPKVFESIDEIETVEPIESVGVIEDVSSSQNDFSGKDLEGYSHTIRELREDRERLLSKVEELELHKDSTKKKHLTIEAMLEEKKIELDIAKNRFREDFEKMSRKLESLRSNEGSVKDKNLELKEEIEKLNKKTFLDMRKVQVREKELASQLGLLRTDTENQIRNRDIIILDLKRKIDILEYDIEQSWKQEKAAKKEKLILQSKIDRLVGSLKDVVESLHEDDIDSWLNKIEKK